MICAAWLGMQAAARATNASPPSPSGTLTDRRAGLVMWLASYSAAGLQQGSRRAEGGGRASSRDATGAAAAFAATVGCCYWLQHHILPDI